MIHAHLREVAIKEFINAIIKGIDCQVKGCIKYDVRCRDPPAITSTFLRNVLGFSEFRVKRFWKVAKSLMGYSLNIYRLRDAWFHLVLNVKKGAVFVVENDNFFPDMFDCMKLKCVEYPNENVLYLYVEGGLGGEALRVNVVYILRRLLDSRPTCYETLMKSVENINEGNLIEGMSGFICVFRVLKDYGNILSDILPVIPRSLSELMLLSPAIGSIVAKIRGKKSRSH